MSGAKIITRHGATFDIPPSPPAVPQESDDDEEEEDVMKPMEPVFDGDGKIFISIVSYRDGERCGQTLKSIFENARHPDNIIVGIVEQNEPDDKFCVEQYCKSFGITSIDRQTIRDGVVKINDRIMDQSKCPRFHQIRLLGSFHINAKGPLFARSMIRKILGNEEFCMQIDAHTTMIRDYDIIAMDEWNRTRNEFAVITNVPASAEEEDRYQPGRDLHTHVPRQCRIMFRENGYPDYEFPADATVRDLTQPLISYGYSAGFSFSKCHFEESVPYDPFNWFAKPVEQFSRYIRLYTRGYDTYTPTRNIVLHNYNEQLNGHGKNEWFKRQRDRHRKESIKRVKMLLQSVGTVDGNIDDGQGTDADLSNLGLYGIGKRRTLDQLMDYINMDFTTKRGNKGDDGTLCTTALQWTPYDTSISPIANLFNKPDNLDPQPEYPLRTNFTYYQQMEDIVPGIRIMDDRTTTRTSGGGRGGTGRSLANPSNVVLPMNEIDGGGGPSASVVFVFWIFGLLVWAIMFVNPASFVAAPMSSSSSKKVHARPKNKQQQQQQKQQYRSGGGSSTTNNEGLMSVVSKAVGSVAASATGGGGGRGIKDV